MKKFTFIKQSVLPILLLLNTTVFSQYYLQVTPCQTSQDVETLVDTLLLGNIAPEYKKNISFTGDPLAVGYFTNGNILGFDNKSGMIMTTGHADLADNDNACNTTANASVNNNGPNNQDPDLEYLGNGAVYDVCKVEFDIFITEDSISLNYVFASEEYHEFVFQFNDVFGFFLSGNAIQGGFSNNAALITTVPESVQYASINTINLGKGGNTCTGKPTGCTNCQYFRDNSQSTDPAFYQMVYDGYTTPLAGTYHVLKGFWYHVKLSIGDVSDAFYDSGIFLEKNFLTQYTITGIKNPGLDKIKIFPNPASKTLYINIPENPSPVNIKLKDITGKVLFEKQNISRNTIVSLESFPKGILILETENESGVKKFTKIIRR